MHNPAHPGDVLREWIPENMSVIEAASQHGVSCPRLSKILNGKAGITAEMALRLSTWLDTTIEVWIDMQATWDLYQAEQRPGP